MRLNCLASATCDESRRNIVKKRPTKAIALIPIFFILIILWNFLQWLENNDMCIFHIYTSIFGDRSLLAVNVRHLYIAIGLRLGEFWEQCLWRDQVVCWIFAFIYVKIYFIVRFFSFLWSLEWTCVIFFYWNSTLKESNGDEFLFVKVGSWTNVK